MTRIVTDKGFGQDDFTGGFVALEGISAGAGCDDCGIDLSPSDDLNAHRDLLLNARAIRISFGSFADGRGFTTAKSLRLMGYTGRLRAGAGSPTSMRWRAGRASMKSRSRTSLPNASPRASGSFGPTGRPMTISRGCAGRSAAEPPV